MGPSVVTRLWRRIKSWFPIELETGASAADIITLIETGQLPERIEPPSGLEPE